MWKWIFGRARFTAEGGNTEKFLNACAERNIPVENICPLPYGITAELPARYYTCLHGIARKQGCRLRLQKKYGLCFSLVKLKKRYGILLGMLAAAFLLLWMPHMVWNIAFYHIPEKQQSSIADAMFEAGVYEGAKFDNQKFQLAEQRVLMQLPEYAWISFNFVRGKVIVEAAETIPKPQILKKESTHIVAGWSGIIQRMEVYNGFAVKQEGQFVKKGELLVSGVGRDWREVLHYAKSRAIIMAYVECGYTTLQPYQYTETVPTGEVKESRCLIFQNARIPLQREAIPDENTIVEFYRKPLSVWGFSLPVTVETTQQIRQQEQTVQLTKEEAKKRAVRTLENIAYSELKTPTILSKEIVTQEQKNGLQVSMKLKVYADIAQEMPIAKK